VVGETRPCAEGGFAGDCALGEQVCVGDGEWAQACSVTPAAADADGCAQGADADCDGTPNEGCDCIAEAKRSCAEGGLRGTCGDGEQLCGADGTWSACSIAAAAADTCDPGNDDDCDGRVNEGCACTPDATRPCAQGGLFGKCAGGSQTCDAQGEWGACSITASAADLCVPGNDDNCNGIANEGCLCLDGATRSCGTCSGSQTCTNGRSGSYDACVGGTADHVFYRDEDGDGFGDATKAVNGCTSTPPTGYVAPRAMDDCCDRDSKSFPGARSPPPEEGPDNMGVFGAPSQCGSWDYDCSGDTTDPWGVTQTQNCKPRGWYQTVPACGSTGTFCVEFGACLCATTRRGCR
jgi:hypothetical protein